MPLYEMRTYTLHVGKMAEAEALYREFGWPALQRGGFDKKLIGYFQPYSGDPNQIMHFWRFEDDADRRAHWAAVRSDEDFVSNFLLKFWTLLASQDVRFFNRTPWGPTL